MDTAAKSPRPYAEMLERAEALRAELAPFCERIEIAGSIRRMRPVCSDIELVVAPRLTSVPDGLFDRKAVNLLDDYAAAAIARGRWQHRLNAAGSKSFGPKYKRVAVDGAAADLFSVLPPAQWGVIFLLRTGPAAFSKRIVTSVSFKDGLMPRDMRCHDGALQRAGAIVETPEEIDVFRALDVGYIEPEARPWR